MNLSGDGSDLQMIRIDAIDGVLRVNIDEIVQPTYRQTYVHPGGFSLRNGVRGCSKVLRCIFIVFGIPMGWF